MDCDGSCVLMIERADVEHDVLSGTVLAPDHDDVNSDDANVLWTAISQLQATLLQATAVGADDTPAAPVDFWAWRKVNRFEVRAVAWLLDPSFRLISINKFASVTGYS